MFIVRIYFVLNSIPTILCLKSVNWTMVLKNLVVDYGGGRFFLFHCSS